MEKCKRMKRQRCMSKNWIYSWQWKFSRTRQQLETITDTQSWYKILPLNGFNLIRAKQKLLRRRQSLRKFLEPSEKPKVIYTDNSLDFGQILWRVILESPNFDTSSTRDEWHCWKSGTQSKRRNVCWLDEKLVVRFFGMLLLFAKCPRPPGRWENSLWRPVRRTI